MTNSCIRSVRRVYWCHKKKSEAGRMLQLLEKQDKEAYFLKHCDVKEKFKDAASSLQNHQAHPHVLVSYTVAWTSDRCVTVFPGTDCCLCSIWHPCEVEDAQSQVKLVCLLKAVMALLVGNQRCISARREKDAWCGHIVDNRHSQSHEMWKIKVEEIFKKRTIFTFNDSQ